MFRVYRIVLKYISGFHYVSFPTLSCKYSLPATVIGRDGGDLVSMSTPTSNYVYPYVAKQQGGIRQDGQ